MPVQQDISAKMKEFKTSELIIVHQDFIVLMDLEVQILVLKEHLAKDKRI